MSSVAVVPGVLFQMSWAYKDQPKSGHVAPDGTSTVGHHMFGVPFKYDQDIVLYLAQKAAQGVRIMRGTFRDLCKWLGTSWRRKATLLRLQRVMSCTVMRENSGHYERFTFGRLIAEKGGEFQIELSPEFLDEVRGGAPYSLDIFRRLRRWAAGARYYLWLIWQLHEAKLRAGAQTTYDPYKHLPQASSRAKAQQNLQEWHRKVMEAWPECPFRAVMLKVINVASRLQRRATGEHTASPHDNGSVEQTGGDAAPDGDGCARRQPAQDAVERGVESRAGQATVARAASSTPGRAGRAESSTPGRAESSTPGRLGRAVAARAALARAASSTPHQDEPNAWKPLSDLACSVQQQAEWMSRLAAELAARVAATGGAPPGAATARGSPPPQRKRIRKRHSTRKQQRARRGRGR